MRGKIFDDLMMFIGYFLPIFIIILVGVIFILTSIFKYYHINISTQYAISIQNQQSQNNQNYPNTINSTIMVDIYYQNGYNIYDVSYVPSFIENLSSNKLSIFYNITNKYSEVNSNNLLAISPSFIVNTNSTSFNVNSLGNVELESTIILSNNTNEGNKVEYTYNGNTYECKIIGDNNIEYQAGSFVYFCILCSSLNGQNIQNLYLNESEYLSITPAIYLLGESQYPNSKYYNYTVDNIEIVNGTYLTVTLSNNGGYSMEDFQNILVIIGPPLSNYIQTSPYVGDNVVFLVNYGDKYYALPSWYAGESNGDYYFFINLLNIPSLYNSNAGCSFLPIFVGFSNENLLPYLNGTIGGAPEALDPSNPSSAIMYDNGLNVFPIYVNFYPYNGNLEEEISCSNNIINNIINLNLKEQFCNNGFEVCFNNAQFNNVLPPYNNVSICLNGKKVNINVVTNGPLQGLLMDYGTNQGSYALITSNVLQNTFYKLSQSQNGLGLQTFAYFSGIPWEDSPSTGGNPVFADAVVLSYVAYNNNFQANTVNDYNDLDLSFPGIGISVGGDTYLPRNFPIFMYEYGWAPNLAIPGLSSGAGPGVSSGYYVGILAYNATLKYYFLTTLWPTNPNLKCIPISPVSVCFGKLSYYYSGSGWAASLTGAIIGGILGGGIGAIIGYNVDRNLKYYFLEVEGFNTYGQNGGSYFPFMPLDQQKNPKYSQYGVFWLYNWFQEGGNTMNIYFLMNGNIFNYSLASVPYIFNLDGGYAIPPAPPENISTITGEPIFVQSYVNAYNTAFNQTNNNYQRALYNYYYFSYGDVNNNFVPGTFGYQEQYNSLSNSVVISYLQDDASVYVGTPSLFVSAGSGGGAGVMYLDWIIVTYGVPYVVSVS
jgi:hypothetical protein